MAVLIDAGILIEAERGRLDLEPHVARHADEEAFLSVITASELLHGVHRAVDPAVRARRSAFVEGLLERFPVLAADLACARAHAQIGPSCTVPARSSAPTTSGWRRPASPTGSSWSPPTCASSSACRGCGGRCGGTA